MVTKYLAFHVLFCSLIIINNGVKAEHLQVDVPSQTGIYNVLDFGAKGDENTLNTKAIQKAIDACAQNGGGEVYFPVGKYITGTIFIKNNVVLNIPQGAFILGSRDIKDYPWLNSRCNYFAPPNSHLDKCLIYADHANNIGIKGKGVIDGRYDEENGLKQDPTWTKAPERPMLLRFYECKELTITDVTLQGSASWCCHIYNTDNVKIDRVYIPNRRQDGFNIESCKNVTISNCTLECGDDGIALTTSSKDRPTKNIAITNCIISSRWAAIRMGPLSKANFENIIVSNCVFHDTFGGGIKIGMYEGAVIKNCIFSDIVMDRVSAPIALYLLPFVPIGVTETEPEPVGSIENIQFNNIRALTINKRVEPWYNKSKAGPGRPNDQRDYIIIHGWSDKNIKNISLRNIDITASGEVGKDVAVREEIPDISDIPQKGWVSNKAEWGIMPSYGMYARHVENLELDNVKFSYEKTDARAAIVMDDIKNLSMQQVDAQAGTAVDHLVRLKDVKGAWISNCSSPQPIPTFIKFQGDKTGNIVFLNNNFSNVSKAYQCEKGANEQEIVLQGNITD